MDYDTITSPARELPALYERAIEAQGCIAVVDFDGDPALALETMEASSWSFYHREIADPGVPRCTTDPELLLRAMRAGYSEFLSKPLDPDEYTDALTRLDHRWSSGARAAR